MRAIGAQRGFVLRMVLHGDAWCSGSCSARRARCWAALVDPVARHGGHPRGQRGALLLLLGPAALPTLHAGNLVAAFVIVLGVRLLHPLPGVPRHPRVARPGDADGGVKPCASSAHRPAQPAQHRRRTAAAGRRHRRRHRAARAPHGLVQRHPGHDARVRHHAHDRPRQRGRLLQGDRGPVRARRHRLPKLVKAHLRKEVPELDYIVQRGRGWAKIVSDTRLHGQVGSGGIDVAGRAGLSQSASSRAPGQARGPGAAGHPAPLRGAGQEARA